MLVPELKLGMKVNIPHCTILPPVLATSHIFIISHQPQKICKAITLLQEMFQPGIFSLRSLKGLLFRNIALWSSFFLKMFQCVGMSGFAIAG